MNMFLFLIASLFSTKRSTLKGLLVTLYLMLGFYALTISKCQYLATTSVCYLSTNSIINPFTMKEWT